jgi:hypothetical protein
MAKTALLSLLFLSLVLSSCSNDFDLFTEREEIPVVFGLLSRADSVHYVRLERAFLDENRSAFLVAGEPDSIYYENAEVRLIDPAGFQPFVLERVNLAEADFPRDEGYFPSDPNFLYAIHADEINLRGGEVYQLEVVVDEEVIARADARVIPDLIIRTPMSGQSLNYQGTVQRPIRWDATPGVEFFNLRLFIRYDERNFQNGGDFEPKVVVWNLANRTQNNIFRLRGNEFLEFLSNAIEDNPNVLRRMRGIDIRLDAGGEELFNYVNVGLANTGITASQEIPIYTNIEGGLGVFSSVNHVILPDFFLHPEALDSLIDGRFTAKLNFIR